MGYPSSVYEQLEKELTPFEKALQKIHRYKMNLSARVLFHNINRAETEDKIPLPTASKRRQRIVKVIEEHGVKPEFILHYQDHINSLELQIADSKAIIELLK
jgi:hypothetical protein